MDQIEKIIFEKMSQEKLNPVVIDFFLKQRQKVKKGETGLVDWSEITSLTSEDLVFLNCLKENHPKNLSKVAICKLNGGLGTSMGLSEPKSLMKVKDDFSFLEITIKQIKCLAQSFHKEPPLILMNSYSTEKKTDIALSKFSTKLQNISSILQNKVPRLNVKNLEPIETKDEKEEWCPPGHGDFWIFLKQSDLLEKLIEQGFEYMFISNIDNLGATLDFRILNYLIENQVEFALEMTEKLECDKKGGSVYKKNHQKKLLEIAQVPEFHKNDFMSKELFPFFSTNNLWIRLNTLKEKLTPEFDLSLIVNKKKIEGKDIIQLETAIASAISNFEKSQIIVVDRSRFLPVKLCEDFLIKQSDFYQLENFQLIKKSPLKEPFIRLDENFYKDFSSFQKHFSIVPSLKKASSLEIKGEFFFDKKIEIIGKVKLINNSHQPIYLSSLTHTSLENETLSF